MYVVSRPRPRTRNLSGSSWAYTLADDDRCGSRAPTPKIADTTWEKRVAAGPVKAPFRTAYDVENIERERARHYKYSNPLGVTSKAADVESV